MPRILKNSKKWKKWGQCANLDKINLQPAASHASWRNPRLSGGHGLGNRVFEWLQRSLAHSMGHDSLGFPWRPVEAGVLIRCLRRVRNFLFKLIQRVYSAFSPLADPVTGKLTNNGAIAVGQRGVAAVFEEPRRVKPCHSPTFQPGSIF